MIASYPAQYKDEFGTESTVIINNGKMMKMSLRGVEFPGDNFHSFGISPATDDSKRKFFNLFENNLCGYFLDCQIPVVLVSEDEVLQTLLQVHVKCGKPVEGRNVFDKQDRISIEILKLELEHQVKIYRSDGRNFYNGFDEQLTELRNSFSADVYLKICWNCAFSDYQPIGSGIFGHLRCFRNLKNEYKQIKDKQGLMLLWTRRAEDVQEIYLCPAF